jgi:hypothetical protein
MYLNHFFYFNCFFKRIKKLKIYFQIVNFKTNPNKIFLMYSSSDDLTLMERNRFNEK